MNKRMLTILDSVKRVYFIFLLLYIFLVISSCCTQRLNNAKTDFNEFEKKYQEIQLDLSVEDSIPFKEFFEEAYLDVQLALEEKGCLGKDDLLADAYLMQALCEFRLDKYKAAKESADAALAEYLDMENKSKPFTMEKKWLVQILPHQVDIEQHGKALIAFYDSQTKNHDQAKSYHLTSIYDPSDTQKAQLEDAIQQLESLKAVSRNSKTVQIAIVSSQLAGLKIWSDGINKFWRSSSTGATMTREEVNQYIKAEEDDHLITRKDILLEELKELLPPAQADKWGSWWNVKI